MMLLISSVFLIGSIAGGAAGCNRLEACNSEFPTGFELAGIQESESSMQYCAELRAYSQCVKRAQKACRGDLNFHSSTSIIESLMKKNKCAQHYASPSYKKPPARPKTTNPVCTHTSNSEYVQCGIFGDPHLKTFSKSYQTCGARGAWPLIDNKYLAIQVTNLPVISSSSATVTTKVTIIIRNVPGCAEEKTFEATSGAPLRPFFIDGSSTTGPEGSVQLKATNMTEKVEIYLRYIDTTLVIRRVGEFLGFSCKLPWNVAKVRDENTLELCQTGCPGTELMDIASTRGHQLSWQTALDKCKETASLDGIVGYGLTDQYLDWCVFDVMTTGMSEFVSTAYLAEEDVRLMDPSSIHNRTIPLDLLRVSQMSASPRTVNVDWLVLCLITIQVYSFQLLSLP